ncbi:MAG: succinylglutamate desuccinylase/aspartoacylase family protein [Thermoleophilales bacterium]|nr:succinylglutamate desuccinylase/aspartoacylase family protein [Thermoleophilales bacterium]
MSRADEITPAPGEPIEVGGVTVPPGERGEVEIHVEQLATGPWISLPTVVLNGRLAGPAVCVTAAVHGDEVNGVEAIRRLLMELRPADMRGTVIAVPVVNELGFMAGSRYLPDGRDLNRSFPGTPRGSLASRLAHLLMEEVVSRCELAIDLHCGSGRRGNLPQIRADLDDQRTLEAAEAFGAPAMIHARLRDGSLREAATQHGVSMLLFEGGESNRFDPYAIEAAFDGVRRVLEHAGVIDGAPGTSTRTFVSRETRWVRASRGGMMRLAVELGEMVERRQVLGGFSDIYGRRNLAVRAPVDGLLIGMNRNPLVNQGDALFHIAERAEGAEPERG